MTRCPKCGFDVSPALGVCGVCQTRLDAAPGVGRSFGLRGLIVAAVATFALGVGVVGYFSRVPARSPEPAQADGNMVPVPAGEFLMGCNAEVDSECEDDEKPGEHVTVGAFSIDKTEVTVAQFRQCVDAGACRADGLEVPYYHGASQLEYASYCNWNKSRENHPINCLNWKQARDFCQWAGKRLPTEAEWEKAARGTDGRRYSWGNAGYGSVAKVANIADEAAKRQYPDFEIAVGYDDGFVGTAPVGLFPAGASPYGALDMIGNVFEWTSTVGPDGYAVRGGSWLNPPTYCRVSRRSEIKAKQRTAAVGFRCAR